MENKNVYWFIELSKDSLAEAGGKGANLAEMANSHFPVPPGFVVSSYAYFDFIKHNHIDEVIQQTCGALNVYDNVALDKASRIVKAAILAGEIPADIHADIVRNYNKLCGASLIPAESQEIYVAIRSSATAEDLPSISQSDQVLVKVNGQTKYCTVKELYDSIGSGENLLLEVPAMKNKKLQWCRAAMLYQHRAKEKLYKITTETGRQITVSGNHSLVLLDTDSLALKVGTVNTIQPSDLIPTVLELPMVGSAPSHLDVLEYVKGPDVVEENSQVFIKNNSTNWRIQQSLPRLIPIDVPFLYFLGMFVAEGSTYENNQVIITNSNPEVQQRIRNFVASLGLNAEVKINKHSIRVYCKSLVRLLHVLCGKPLEGVKGKGKSCSIKRVPDFVFGLSKEQIGWFISGGIDGDGSVLDSHIDYYTNSEILAGGMAKLFELIGVENYLRYRKSSHSYSVSVPVYEHEKFVNFLSLLTTKNSTKLKDAILKYGQKEKHIYPLKQLNISDKLSEKIHGEFDNSLEKRAVNKYHCPSCDSKIENNQRYNGKTLYYCRPCKKAYYEDQAVLRKEEAYVGYDEKGRFTVGQVPWNKGRLKGWHPYKTIQQFLTNRGATETAALFDETFGSNIRWESIVKVEPVEYDGFVYDFVVPEVENFAAGFGGIITHNTASFAGQNETFLNIKGGEKAVQTVKKCWASLFGSRSIYYRVEQGFDHLQVGLACVVQKMCQSEISGVMFSADPFTGDQSKIVVEGGFGLGEAVVSGSITPDRYVVDKASLQIIDKRIARQTRMITKVKGVDQWVNVEEELTEAQKVPDRAVLQLADYGKRLESHYGRPQDVEWGVENGKVYIVQTRAITTLKPKQLVQPAPVVEVKEERMEEKKEEREENVAQSLSESVAEKVEPIMSQSQSESSSSEEALVQGLPASPGLASGPVRLILDIKDLYKVKKGDVLVTQMTTPDYVPAMKRACAIVTDEGGTTAHAAIVSRELGVPCIVGTGNATRVLRDGEIVTVDADHGSVYPGALEGKPLSGKKAAEGKIATSSVVITGTKIYVNLAQPERADEIALEDVDGVGLLRAEFIIAAMGKHPRLFIKEHREQEFIDTLAKALRKVCAPFGNRPVVYRATDFKTNEYRNLEGGKEFEPHEENPMLGYRGCFRYLKEPDVFAMELAAIRKTREQYGMKNLHLMIPFVRTVHEFQQVKKLVGVSGLVQNHDFKLGIMCEVPSTVILAEEFCAAGVDFFSIGSNDLTQLTLGVDRDSTIVAEEFDERDEAIIRSIQKVIKACHKFGVKVSICGQAPSVYPELTEKLVEFGIDSISVNPDVIEKTRRIVASSEQRQLLRK